jgi:capsular polysaccharide biosynthesis protein
MGEELAIIRKPVTAPSPTMRDLLAVLFRQRRLGLISFTAIFLAVTLYGVLAPSYQPHMKVLVRRGRVDAPVTPTPTPSPMFQREEVTEEELNSQVELLRDDEILRAVVVAAGLTRASWYDRLLGSNEETRLARAVRRMTRRLRVEPMRKTNLIQVAYSSADPEQAAAVLHSLAHVYLERQQRVRRPSGEFEFFEQQVVQARRGLLEAEFHLMDFTSDQGVGIRGPGTGHGAAEAQRRRSQQPPDSGGDRRNRTTYPGSAGQAAVLARADGHCGAQFRQPAAFGKNEIETAGTAAEANRTAHQI